jgi:hypothetical protein
VVQKREINVKENGRSGNDYEETKKRVNKGKIWRKENEEKVR